MKFIAHLFGGGKDPKKPGGLSTVTTINGVPISGPGSPFGSPGSDAPDPKATPPVPPPSAPAADSNAAAAAAIAQQKTKKRAAAGNTLATGPVSMPGGTPTANVPPRTLLGG
jgi:hypothetical protein